MQVVTAAVDCVEDSADGWNCSVNGVHPGLCPNWMAACKDSKRTHREYNEKYSTVAEFISQHRMFLQFPDSQCDVLLGDTVYSLNCCILGSYSGTATAHSTGAVPGGFGSAKQ